MNHLVELFLDVAGLAVAAVVGHQGRRADDHIGHAALAAAVVGTVIAGEALHQQSGESGLAAHEHAVPWDEHVLQHRQALAAHDAVLGVALIHVALALAVVVGLAAEDVQHALGVHRNGAADGVLGLVLLHAHGGHDEHLVAVDHAGHVGLCAPDDDAVIPLFHHMDEQVGILLLAGPQAAVALHVGHGAGDHQVVLLHVLQILLEPLMVVGTHGLIDLVGDGVGGVHGVEAHAALIAGAGLLGDHPQHLHLLHQILGGLVDVGEAVDLLTGQVGGGGHQLLVLLHARQGVGHGGGVDVTTDEGVVDEGLGIQQLALQIDLDLPAAQAVFIFLGSFHGGSPYFTQSLRMRCQVASRSAMMRSRSWSSRLAKRLCFFR